MEVDAPLGFDALGDPLSPGSASPPELAAPIGLGASLPPLPPKQGGKSPFIVWRHFTKLPSGDPKKPKSQCNYCKTQCNCHGKTNGTSGMLHHMNVCKKWHFFP